jgi:hypothetical protein
MSSSVASVDLISALVLIRDGRCPCGGRFKWFATQLRCEQCDRHGGAPEPRAKEIATNALDAHLREASDAAV